ncbi:MAG: hypothetical protein P8N76_08675 [Pirellulaceae bacterium]|nr:hypothetical protein [Pirellulaceae bacterium]
MTNRLLRWQPRLLTAIVFCAATTLACLPTTVGGTERDDLLVKGLCQRSLYRQAELLCLDEIKQSAGKPQQQADWYKLLFKTYAQQALNASESARESIWKAAGEQWDRFQQEPIDPQRPDIELQYRLIELARGELLASAIDLSNNRAQAVRNATAQLRQTSQALEKLAESVATQQRTASAKERLSSRALQQLHALIEFKLGESLRQQAFCYPPDSPDYVHLLTQAVRRFDSVARLAGSSELTRLSQLAEIDCHRRLGNRAETRQGIERLSNADLSQELREKLIIQQAELLIDRQAARQAIDLLEKNLFQAKGSEDRPTLALAELSILRAYLALVRTASTAGHDNRAQQWQSSALRLVRKMEKTRTPYWAHLAQREISTIRLRATGFADVDVLERTAATQYRRDQFEEAIATYRRAAELAQQLNDQNRSFDLGFQAAAIEYKQHEFAEARNAFRQLAIQHPDNIRASQAHLLAITSAARLAKKSAAEFESYEALLFEHLRQWTRHPSANQVRWWLGNLQYGRSEWLAAIDSWILIDPSFEKITEVRDRLRSSFLKLLKNPQVTKTEKVSLAEKASKYFEQAAAANNKNLDHWTDQSRLAITDAATFHLLFTNQSPAAILPALRSAAASDNRSARWASTTQAILGLAEGLSRNITAANALFAQVDWSKVDKQIDIVARLNQECRINPAAANTLAKLTLELTKQITNSSPNLSDDQRDALNQFNAEAYAYQSKPLAAIKIYNALIDQRPTDRVVQQRLAELYAARASDRDQTAALEHWRRVIRLSPAGGSNWFQAKLGVARALAKLGQTERAVEVIQLTMALHPDMNSKATQRAFEKLLRELKKKRSLGDSN